MISRIFKYAAGLTAALALTLMPVASVSAAAGTGTASLSLSPASSQQTAGTSFTVNINVNSSEPVASVQADINYDASKLRCDGVSGAGSAFPTDYHTSCGGGSISVARGVQGTPVPGGKVATVTFTVLGNSGSAALTAAGSSEIYNTNVENACNSTCVSGAQLASVSMVPAPVAPTTPSNTGTAPTTKTTPKAVASNNTAASNGTVAGEETEVPATTAATDDKKKDEAKKSDDKKTDNKKTSSNMSWFWLLAIVAALAGYVAARRYRSAQAGTKAASAEKTAVAPVAATPSEGKRRKGSKVKSDK